MLLKFARKYQTSLISTFTLHQHSPPGKIVPPASVTHFLMPNISPFINLINKFIIINFSLIPPPPTSQRYSTGSVDPVIKKEFLCLSPAEIIMNLSTAEISSSIAMSTRPVLYVLSLRLLFPTARL